MFLIKVDLQKYFLDCCHHHLKRYENCCYSIFKANTITETFNKHKHNWWFRGFIVHDILTVGDSLKSDYIYKQDFFLLKILTVAEAYLADIHTKFHIKIRTNEEIDNFCTIITLTQISQELHIVWILFPFDIFSSCA